MPARAGRRSCLAGRPRGPAAGRVARRPPRSGSRRPRPARLRSRQRAGDQVVGVEADLVHARQQRGQRQRQAAELERADPLAPDRQRQVAPRAGPVRNRSVVSKAARRRRRPPSRPVPAPGTSVPGSRKPSGRMNRYWPSPESWVSKRERRLGAHQRIRVGRRASRASRVTPPSRTISRVPSTVAAGTFSEPPFSVVPPGVTGKTRLTSSPNSCARLRSQRLVATLAAVVVGDEPDAAVLAADVDAALAERRRAVEVVAVAKRRALGRGVERPAPRSGGRVQRVELAVGGADVDDLALAVRLPSERRRGADRLAGVSSATSGCRRDARRRPSRRRRRCRSRSSRPPRHCASAGEL